MGITYDWFILILDVYKILWVWISAISGQCGRLLGANQWFLEMVIMMRRNRNSQFAKKNGVVQGTHAIVGKPVQAVIELSYVFHP